MINVSLFVEDSGHEKIIGALLNRYQSHFKIQIQVHYRNVRGGHGTALTELKEFLRDMKRGVVDVPDLLIVGIDANCKGYIEARREIVELVTKAERDPITIYAIPDPHVERWLLLDSAAFKEVLGKGCKAPDQKCERGRYKRALADAVREAGLLPLLGGLEHAEDIIKALDLVRVKAADASIRHFLDALEAQFKRWQLAEQSKPTPTEEE
jgi:hypothetical protein